MPDLASVELPVKKIKKLKELKTKMRQFEDELSVMTRRGDDIRNELNKLTDQVKIIKIKSYIDNKL